MTTRLLAQRPSLFEQAGLELILERAGLGGAWNIVAERDPHRLEIVVDDFPCLVLEVAADLAPACGVALAAALLERQGTDWKRWVVRVLEWDGQMGASIVLREWRAED